MAYLSAYSDDDRFGCQRRFYTYGDEYGYWGRSTAAFSDRSDQRCDSKLRDDTVVASCLVFMVLDSQTDKIERGMKINHS